MEVQLDRRALEEGLQPLNGRVVAARVVAHADLDASEVFGPHVRRESAATKIPETHTDPGQTLRLELVIEAFIAEQPLFPCHPFL